MPHIIFIADNHSNPTSTESLIAALPCLHSNGFDTVCVELSEGMNTPALAEQIHEQDYKIKLAIEQKNTRKLAALEKIFGKDMIDAERSIATSARTHLAYKNLASKIGELQMAYKPIDVESPTQTDDKTRNDHMVLKVKAALDSSKTKNIIVFAGYAHIASLFGSSVGSTRYSRGLISRLCNDDNTAGLYFTYSEKDSAYRQIQQIRAYAPLAILKHDRVIEVIDGNYAPFIEQLQKDISKPTSDVEEEENKHLDYGLLLASAKQAGPYNSDTMHYLKDLGAQNLLMDAQSIPNFIILKFSLPSERMSEEVLHKLRLRKEFFPGTFTEASLGAVKRKYFPVICTIEISTQPEPGTYFTFPNRNNWRPEQFRLYIEAELKPASKNRPSPA